MDPSQIREIVSWLRTHSGEPHKHETAAEIWLGFCQRPSLIKEMNTLKNQVYARNDSERCSYIFFSNEETCKVLRAPGKDRCHYHDHPIFSDQLRKYLQEMHSEINEQCRKKIRTTQVGPNLFRETEHNLAIRLNDYDKPYCVGYFLSTEDDSISQLTPGLETVCRKMGLSYS